MSQKAQRKSPCHCINIRRISNTISHMYDSILEPIGVSANQYALIVDLNKLKNASTTELANFVGLDRSTLVRTLKPLINKELIEDISEPNARNRILQLTNAGKQKIKEGRPLWLEAQAQLEKKIGPEAVSMIHEISDKL